ncbi:MAG: TolC family protein [Coleofasciculus sp. S288]|nr:TolC family protein [Coleofasciculus sp. S288]
MPTFRYFVAIGVGAAIALSCMEPGTSKDLASLAQPQSDRKNDECTKQKDECKSSDLSAELTASPQDSQEGEAIADGGDEPTASADEPVATPSNSSVSEQPQEAEPLAEADDKSTNLAQSSEPVPSLTPQAPAPDILLLNTNSNPLLFPTRSEEVQVETTVPITLEQALELAQRNNNQLQTARLNLERAQYDLEAALAERSPTGTLRADFTRTDSAQQELNQGGTSVVDQVRQLLGLPPADDDDQDDTVTTSLSSTVELSYDIYTGGRRAAQIRAAREQVRLQELEVESLVADLFLDVANAYYNLQETDAQVEIAQAAVVDARQSLRDAQLLEQAGLGTRFDVLQAEVQLANNNQELTRSLNQQRITRRQIAQLLSLAQTAEISAADPIEVAGEWELSLEQSIILAYKNRAELEQQLVQRNINEQQRRIQLAAIRPQASVFANYNVLALLEDEGDLADGFALGARLQWNFFDGGAARARANQEEVDIAIAEQNFATQRNQTRFEVEQAFFNLRANAENIQTASFALTQAQESLRLARLRFQAGVGTQTDVINQQTELTRARVNQLNAILDYNRALAALQRAVSNLSDSALVDAP